jgi:hypothetical protein
MYAGVESVHGAPMDGTPSGGVCIGDYDNDGRPDIYFSQPAGPRRLYRNLGDFRFEDVTEKTGLAGQKIWAMGASWIDIDNDDDLDLYVCAYAGNNQLYINQGDGTFKEKAKSFRLDYKGPSVMIIFADYDLDGDMDGFLLTHRGIIPKTMPKDETLQVYMENGQPRVESAMLHEYVHVLLMPPTPEKPMGQLTFVHGGSLDHLYRNNGVDTASPTW